MEATALLLWLAIIVAFQEGNLAGAGPVHTEAHGEPREVEGLAQTVLHDEQLAASHPLQSNNLWGVPEDIAHSVIFSPPPSHHPALHLHHHSYKGKTPLHSFIGPSRMQFPPSDGVDERGMDLDLSLRLQVGSQGTSLNSGMTSQVLNTSERVTSFDDSQIASSSFAYTSPASTQRSLRNAIQNTNKERKLEQRRMKRREKGGEQKQRRREKYKALPEDFKKEKYQREHAKRKKVIAEMTTEKYEVYLENRRLTNQRSKKNVKLRAEMRKLQQSQDHTQVNQDMGGTPSVVTSSDKEREVERQRGKEPAQLPSPSFLPHYD